MKTNAGKKICIVTNGPISQSPRVVKEAEALSGHGYNVSVLSAQHMLFTLPLDEKIAENKAWRLYSLIYAPSDVRSKLRRLGYKLQALIFSGCTRVTFNYGIAELAYSRTLVGQLLMAIREKSDLYIAHNVQSLPIAAWAARITKAKYGFDAEDLHCGEFRAEEENTIRAKIVRFIQAKYLKGCTFVTASSPDIGEQLVARYGIDNPTVVLNVFPLSEREAQGNQVSQIQETDPQRSVSFYWYSQTISLDRGLQDAIAAIGRVKESVQLHLRGGLSNRVKKELNRLAQSCGAMDRLFFHETVAPQKLLECAIEHDVGLCLEPKSNLNNDLAISNKLFLFLLAGLAIVATETKGQKVVMSNLPDVGFTYQPGDVDELTEIMTWLVVNRDGLDVMKEAAYMAASEKWNWERERENLIDAVQLALRAT